MGREDERGIPPWKGVQGDVPLASFEFSPNRTSPAACGMKAYEAFIPLQIQRGNLKAQPL